MDWYSCPVPAVDKIFSLKYFVIQVALVGTDKTELMTYFWGFNYDEKIKNNTTCRTVCGIVAPSEVSAVVPRGDAIDFKIMGVAIIGAALARVWTHAWDIKKHEAELDPKHGIIDNLAKIEMEQLDKVRRERQRPPTDVNANPVKTPLDEQIEAEVISNLQNDEHFQKLKNKLLESSPRVNVSFNMKKRVAEYEKIVGGYNVLHRELSDYEEWQQLDHRKDHYNWILRPSAYALALGGSGLWCMGYFAAKR